MSEDTGQSGHLETRIVNAIELARAEQERWQGQLDAATSETEQLEATVHLAASNAVIGVLEEILEPGTRSQGQEPSG
ncbi:hypothetical protein [Actinomycetospora sp. TBRC 11914]|uniref:hypothetical protein n=1 Tax=Actinomycetospora sp. TBRC 11914 TaxID=2729387 RepID=UPI00145F2B08|nr:hypothetical protein [Actinomycetospora sp. TBRC 11914]NMO91541.1 hypothetical protein [Actinomycetospora sp. TBRC 11914]